MRQLVLALTLLFIAALTALTIVDIADNGVTPLDAVAFLVLALFAVGIVGALWHPSSADPLEQAHTARRERDDGR